MSYHYNHNRGFFWGAQVVIILAVILAVVWIVNLMDSTPYLTDSSIGHDKLWMIILGALGLLLLILQIIILLPEGKEREEDEFLDEEEWDDEVDDADWEVAGDDWDDVEDDWEWQEQDGASFISGDMDELSRVYREGDVLLGCEHCGTVILRRPHEIDEEHEWHFNCPNCEKPGHYDPRDQGLNVDIFDHKCNNCSYEYQAYQSVHECPSCHQQQSHHS